MFDDAKAGTTVRLFKSHRDGIADGDQRRDFIYVDDAVAVMRWLLDSAAVNGIFNVGTGKARSFRDMIAAMFTALGRHAEYRIYRHAGGRSADSYQYFTQASVDNLRRAGYNAGFTPLEDAVAAYVNDSSIRPTGTADRAADTDVQMFDFETLSQCHASSRPCSASAI